MIGSLASIQRHRESSSTLSSHLSLSLSVSLSLSLCLSLSLSLSPFVSVSLSLSLISPAVSLSLSLSVSSHLLSLSPSLPPSGTITANQGKSVHGPYPPTRPLAARPPPGLHHLDHLQMEITLVDRLPPIAAQIAAKDLKGPLHQLEA
jgi:hypothetical protein